MGNINPFPSHNIEKSKGKTLKFEQSLPQLANMAALGQYDWLLAIITIAFCFSAFGNGANDVANSYATSVAARTLTMIQVGFLSIVTEFVGAVALGARVTSTIKNGIISIDRFEDRPGVLMLATRLGMPVSTTRTYCLLFCGLEFKS